MPGLSNAASQFLTGRVIAPSLVVGVAVLLFAGLSQAQIHGIPPLATSIPNHTYPYLPNAPASVTSLGPNGYCCTKPWNVPPVWGPVGSHGHGNGHGRGGNGIRGYGYGYAFGAAVPYYYMYPAYDYGYPDDPGAGGPYQESGPPQGGPGAPAGQMPIIVEQPPVRQPATIDQASVPAPEPAPQLPEVTPGIPTVLVFRNGHKQEVTNYAIMGQTVYVFDKGTKKIAIADLDIPATIKANDDAGVEFTVPQDKKPSKPAVSAPRQSTPAPKTPDPNTLTSSLLP